MQKKDKNSCENQTNRIKTIRYIRYSFEKTLRERQEYTFFGDIYVYVKDPMPENIDLAAVLGEVENTVPLQLAKEIDMIYVGRFEELAERELQALYKDGALYLTNLQHSEEQMIENIIHELAHAIEEAYGTDIYMDGAIEKEFLGKRKRLFDILKAEGYELPLEPFMNSEYSSEFDNFLYKEIGYPSLTALTMGLFLSPYAATSLREYFANGFEGYYTDDPRYLQKVSPQLFIKIDNIARI